MPSESGSSHQYMASSVSGFYLQPKDINGKNHSWFLFDWPHGYGFFLMTHRLLLQVFVSWTQGARPTWRPPSTLCSAITKVRSARCCAGTKCTPAIPLRTSQVCKKLKLLLYHSGMAGSLFIFFLTPRLFRGSEARLRGRLQRQPDQRQKEGLLPVGAFRPVLFRRSDAASEIERRSRPVASAERAPTVCGGGRSQQETS